MGIASYAFLLLFLPISLLIYWLLLKGGRAKLWFLCAISLLFYGLSGVEYIPLLILLSAFTFLAAWRQNKNLTRLGILVNLLALGVFKYWDFGADNLNTLGEDLNIESLIPLLELALPLGISFYVFKHLGYLLDVQAGVTPPTSDFLAFLTYSAFFPQISAGPISGFQDTGEQLRSLPAQADREQLTRGLVFISIGLIKKLLIADTLADGLDPLYDVATSDFGVLQSWVFVSVFALQLYFDFSGYTDIVLGVGMLFGVSLPPNFDNPYLAGNPSQFWQRWHISLSSWFRTYVFLPLSRSLLRRWGMERREPAQYVSNMVTMLLVGLWHGAGWGFILWGGFHGLLLNIHAGFERRRRIPAYPVLLNILFLAAILLGWALFLSPDLAYAADLIGNMFGMNGLGTLGTLNELYEPTVLAAVVAAIAVTFSGMVEAANLPEARKPAFAVLLGALAALAIMQLGEPIQFLYVQF
jgi:alginate O-acetyltransferase complex protein AlgI